MQVLICGLQVLIMFVGGGVFKVERLSGLEWVVSIVIGAGAIPVALLVKIFTRWGGWAGWGAVQRRVCSRAAGLFAGRARNLRNRQCEGLPPTDTSAGSWGAPRIALSASQRAAWAAALLALCCAVLRRAVRSFLSCSCRAGPAAPRRRPRMPPSSRNIPWSTWSPGIKRKGGFGVFRQGAGIVFASADVFACAF